jgi:subtilisin
MFMKKPGCWCRFLLIFSLFCLALPAQAAFAASAAERSVIIGFKQRPGPAERDLVRGQRGRVKKSFRLIKAFAAKVPEQAIARLRSDPRVRYVAEDAVVSVVDPELSDAEYGSSWGVEHIGCRAVHEQDITGHGIKIAVLDTGVDYTHPELAANYQGGHDFIFNDDDPVDDSWNSHGTHVAGIIAAAADGNGVIGGAPEASLYAVKVLAGDGGSRTSIVIAGIEWAVENNMDIVNLSFAGPDSLALREACDAAYGAGLLLVAAAGNTSGGDVLYPAAYESVIAVSASDRLDLPAWFSPQDGEVELMAPGLEILSTTAGAQYALLSGTSQAAPHVTAAAALIMAGGMTDINDDGVADNRDVRLRLQQTAMDLGASGRDELYGFGLVNAEAAAGDQDVDGLDLVLFARQLAAGSNSISLADFAAGFGR